MSNLRTGALIREEQTGLGRGGGVGVLFPLSRMHLPYTQAHLASEEEPQLRARQQARPGRFRAHNPASVPNSEQLRLYYLFSANILLPPSFTAETASSNKQSHRSSRAHTDKQTIVELAHRLELLVRSKLQMILKSRETRIFFRFSLLHNCFLRKECHAFNNKSVD